MGPLDRVKLLHRKPDREVGWATSCFVFTPPGEANEQVALTVSITSGGVEPMEGLAELEVDGVLRPIEVLRVNRGKSYWFVRAVFLQPKS